MVAKAAQARPRPIDKAAMNRRIELIFILGFLNFFAPLTIDIYLPAMPRLSQVFGVEASRVQLTLAAFFAGFALGQAFFGPLADRYGRKWPLYIGLVLYVASSAGCALAPSVEAMIVLRFVQAVGACACVVVSRAIASDCFEPQEVARVFALLMLVGGVAPIIAPLIGGYLLIWLGWQSIFWVLAGFGLFILAAVILRLPETRGADSSRPLALLPVLRVYGRLLAHRQFLGDSLVAAFSLSGMFAYIAGSPFVFIEFFHLPPNRFGWLFAVNSCGIMAASQVNRALLRRISAAAMLRGASLVQAVFGVVLLVAALTAMGGMLGIAIPQFAFVAFIGLVLPVATALAMAPHRGEAGAASALYGSIQYVLAAATATAVGALHAVTPVPMAAIIAACGVIGVACHRALAPRR